MSYLYGPIPSRRLGQSLGVDPIPLKTCNWNCVYCQLGRSMPLINERAEYVPRKEIIAELEQVLAAHAPGEIDYISFVGSGEPTLHVGLGWLIRRAQELSDIPVAVITNGALLHCAAVRSELLAADVVMPTLCAGNAALYRRIHRPHPEATFARLLSGLHAFRAEYAGRLWIEVMLLRDVNDGEAELRELAEVLATIGPDEVHVTLPTRPPSETWVAPSDEAGLLRATAILGEIAHVVHPSAGHFDLRGYESVVDAVVAIVTRHPMSHNQLLETLDRWAPNEVEAALLQLAASGRVQEVKRYGVRFWSGAQAHFPAPG
jgi:wyosine [tRNA(Phe)-imidazoG37] synthetase (radical SAM superfamily)